MMKMNQMLAFFAMLACIYISAESAYIRILGTRGELKQIDIDANATVAELKDAIQDQLGIPVETQNRIIFANKILKNNAELLNKAVGGGDFSGRIFYLKLK